MHAQQDRQIEARDAEVQHVAQPAERRGGVMNDALEVHLLERLRVAVGADGQSRADQLPQLERVGVHASWSCVCRSRLEGDTVRMRQGVLVRLRMCVSVPVPMRVVVAAVGAALGLERLVVMHDGEAELGNHRVEHVVREVTHPARADLEGDVAVAQVVCDLREAA